MKAREFVVESVETASAEQVWNYVDGIHPDDQKGGGFLKGLIMRYPQYELRRIPLSSIHIPDQEYDDEEQEPEADPYNRVQAIDPEHAGEYSQHFVDRRPIVIDSQGWIIDGNHRAWAAAELLNKNDIMAWVPVKQGVIENIPQPGESSGAPKKFGPDAKIEARPMTVKQIISSIPGVPYYNNVVDDYDAKDYSWGVTKKVIEYATYLKQHPESLSQLPPIIVLNGKFEDGAHRVSAIWLLQQRMDPKNPLWANARLNVQFVQQGAAEGQLNELGNTPADYKPNRKRKRSLFHATVDNQWVDVFFDRSEFNDTLHITFAVNGDYDTPSQPTSASKSTVRILSTVLNIIKQQLPEYIAKARPPGISFTAKGDNRASLYRKYFVPVVQNILGPKWAHEEYPSMGMTVFHWRPIQKNTDKELSEIARIPQGDFGDKDTLVAPKSTPRNLKPLPGGSRFTYAVNKKSSDEIEIMIFDGEQLVAELDIFATQDPLNTWEVNSVATDPDYRGQGLGKALYGIALTILKLTLEAGEIQTKHGQQMWIMLNSIPGVEVKGYAMAPTEEYRQKRGDQIVDQNATWTRYIFPVEPGTRSMRSTRRGTGIYSSQLVSMIAKWTGR